MDPEERSSIDSTDKETSDRDCDEQEEVILGEAKFFDSTSYRCCFSIFHAKIGTFVVVTLVFHEIIIGILYLLSHEELKFRERNLYYVTVFGSRILQLFFAGVIYIGLWLQRRRLLLPFAVSQLTFGIFADISTWLFIVKHREEQLLWLPFVNSWRSLNIILPLIIYVILVACLMLVLRQCSVYFRDRAAYEQRRKEIHQHDLGTVRFKISEEEFNNSNDPT